MIVLLDFYEKSIEKEYFLLFFVFLNIQVFYHYYDYDYRIIVANIQQHLINFTIMKD